MSVKPTACGTPQKRLNFDVPEQLANDFKAYAAHQGKSQREIIVAFMQRCTRRGPIAGTTSTSEESTHE